MFPRPAIVRDEVKFIDIFKTSLIIINIVFKIYINFKGLNFFFLEFFFIYDSSLFKIKVSCYDLRVTKIMIK